VYEVIADIAGIAYTTRYDDICAQSNTTLPLAGKHLSHLLTQLLFTRIMLLQVANIGVLLASKLIQITCKWTLMAIQ
jgi:hypothetical protein